MKTLYGRLCPDCGHEAGYHRNRANRITANCKREGCWNCTRSFEDIEQDFNFDWEDFEDGLIFTRHLLKCKADCRQRKGWVALRDNPVDKYKRKMSGRGHDGLIETIIWRIKWSIEDALKRK